VVLIFVMIHLFDALAEPFHIFTLTEFLEGGVNFATCVFLIDGVVLLGEAGPAAEHAMHDNSLTLKLFGYEMVPMSKTTFYFSVLVLVGVELIQSGYRRKLNSQRLSETPR
jgi:hypothetical protein